MHYARWHRTGNPLLKLRARGVLDAPIVRRPKLQPPQTRSRKVCGLTSGQFAVLKAMAMGYCEVEDIARKAGVTRASVVRHVSSIRLRYGWDVVETVFPKGQRQGLYVLGDEVLEAVLR
jgi:hypothetical protein